MAGEIHPLAPHSLPPFIAGADGSDPLFTVVVIFVVALVLGVGVLYLKIHAIPEQLVHKHGNTQSQLIMVLALLALFTHNNIFWVIALVLALIKFPDLMTPLNQISKSVARLSGEDPPAEPASAEDQPAETPPATDGEEEK